MAFFVQINYNLNKFFISNKKVRQFRSQYLTFQFNVYSSKEGTILYNSNTNNSKDIIEGGITNNLNLGLV